MIVEKTRLKFFWIILLTDVTLLFLTHCLIVEINSWEAIFNNLRPLFS